MKNRKLLWQIFPSFGIVILISVVATAAYFSNSLKHFYLTRVAEDLEHKARLFITMLPDADIDALPSADLEALCLRIHDQVPTRITIIAPSGKVLADTGKDPESMENHANRPEIKRAMKGSVGKSIRFSKTIGTEMMYVAVPLEHKGKVVGVVRASTPMTTLYQTLRSAYFKIAVAGLIIAVFGAALSFFATQRINRPIRQLQTGAEKFSAGDLNYRLNITGAEEFHQLALSMNEMARGLDERIRFITRQRNELEAVLSSMVEAVIAVDPGAVVIRYNQAAGELFHIKQKSHKPLRVRDITDNKSLQEFVDQALTSKDPISADIVLTGDQDMFLQAHGTLLHDAAGQGAGALIVLHDLTKIKKLENIRRDFVANVSHELKTPITSINGFIETLRDGAIDDPEHARKFLEIISNQADRLTAIIDDLLSLARIEQSSGNEAITLERCSVKDVLHAAINDCASKSAQRRIDIELRCPEPLDAMINPALLEQAVVNLIDNAIKYSPSPSKIIVGAELDQRASEVRISVGDSGCGIPKEHLPRIFERFYRVDKARSRKQGGTGLGLAIVKHIAAAHGGGVTVQSEVDKGSVFTIRLPLFQAMASDPSGPQTES